MDQITLAFITGLTAGGISCFAVQGGLLATSIGQVEPTQKKFATVSFVVAKIVSYGLLGALLGAFGSALSITPTVQGWLQIIAGVYMLATAANLLNLHPIFRYVVIKPPKWAYKLLKKESQRNLMGPVILGALTILIPCGITQGFMLAAIASGSALIGALILLAFTLGTSPLFLLIGVAASSLFQKKAFVYAASTVIIILGVISINSGQGLRGSLHTFQNYWAAINDRQSYKGKLAIVDSSGTQEVNINVKSNGYTADANVIKKGVPVKIKLRSEDTAGCARAFTIPSLGISKILPATGEEELEFTPTKEGVLAYSCSMGMYTGYFTVI